MPDSEVGKALTGRNGEASAAVEAAYSEAVKRSVLDRLIELMVGAAGVKPKPLQKPEEMHGMGIRG